MNDVQAIEALARRAAGDLSKLKPGPGNAVGMVIDFDRIVDGQGKKIPLEKWLVLHWLAHPSTFPVREYNLLLEA